MKARAGFALPLVLGIIVILATICTGVAVATRRTTDAAVMYRDQVSARYAAESGINVAVMSRRPEHIELEGASVDVEVIDVGSLLDVNMADEAGLTRLFSYFTTQRDAERAARAVRSRLPLHSLAQLRAIAEVPDAAERYLTIDGDGYINTMTASDTVRSAAGGALTNAATRLMLIAHGRSGESEVEITAVYGIQATGLALIRWEEARR